MAKGLSKIVQKIRFNQIEEEHNVDSLQRESYTIFLELDPNVKQ